MSLLDPPSQLSCTKNVLMNDQFLKQIGEFIHCSCLNLYVLLLFVFCFVFLRKKREII